jgi:hypothetical protein
MKTLQMTRRSALGAMAALPCSAVSGWTEMFDGSSLKGWRASGDAASWKVEDGMLVGDGPVSHLFHEGTYRDFEFEADVFTEPGCNSGIYFHTVFQEKGFPIRGFEVQVNNSAQGEGRYRERKRTGSLYGIRNVYRAVAEDREWFRVGIRVQGKNVQVRVNGLLMVDFVEATPPVLPPSQERERYLSEGAFALQCHDAGSKVRYRNLRVRAIGPLASNAPVVDETYRKVIELGAKNYPLVDWHVHLKPGLGMAEAMERSRRDGIAYGIAANCGRFSQYRTEAGARGFLESVSGQTAFVGMQAESADWMSVFPRELCARFDYVFNDGMIYADAAGKWVRLYNANDMKDAARDAEGWMEAHVGRVVKMLDQQPLDIYAIPTYLPEVLEWRREALWTEARMRRVAEAAARNGVAIEFSGRYRLPGEGFARIAKEMGCQFAFGTGNSMAADLGRSEYGLEMVGKLGLAWSDLFVPGGRFPKAVVRRGHLFA